MFRKLFALMFTGLFILTACGKSPSTTTTTAVPTPEPTATPAVVSPAALVYFVKLEVLRIYQPESGTKPYKLEITLYDGVRPILIHTDYFSFWRVTNVGGITDIDAHQPQVAPDFMPSEGDYARTYEIPKGTMVGWINSIQRSDDPNAEPDTYVDVRMIQYFERTDTDRAVMDFADLAINHYRPSKVREIGAVSAVTNPEEMWNTNPFIYNNNLAEIQLDLDSYVPGDVCRILWVSISEWGISQLDVDRLAGLCQPILSTYNNNIVPWEKMSISDGWIVTDTAIYSAFVYNGNDIPDLFSAHVQDAPELCIGSTISFAEKQFPITEAGLWYAEGGFVMDGGIVFDSRPDESGAWYDVYAPYGDYIIVTPWNEDTESNDPAYYQIYHVCNPQ